MSPQQSIAHYRIVLDFGEGGIGAVYRASDAKLIAVDQDDETKRRVLSDWTVLLNNREEAK